MTIYTRHIIIVIAAPLQPALNQAALQYDTTGGEYTFTVPLYPHGGPYTSPSHYWACMVMEEAMYQMLIAAYASQMQAGNIHVYSVKDGDPAATTPAAVLTALGLETAPAPLGGP